MQYGFTMPAITLKNIPDSLYLQLKKAAHAHHRSLNSEVLYCVERTLGTYKIDVEEQITIARALREKTDTCHATDAELTLAKNEGRF